MRGLRPIWQDRSSKLGKARCCSDNCCDGLLKHFYKQRDGGDELKGEMSSLLFLNGPVAIYNEPPKDENSGNEQYGAFQDSGNRRPLKR